MLTKDKRSPAFEDTDKMLFGKFKGELLQDVPASYLRWLWGEIKDSSVNITDTKSVKTPLNIDKIKLANYIWNSKAAIEQELGETL